MKEIIKSIAYHEEDYKAGYKITTDAQEIKLLIDDHQSCCESWGYFLSEEDIQSFVGSELLGISLTDTALEKVLLEHKDDIDIYEGGVMFVNLETSNGLLQFVAYNCHNGYYGHEAVVISNQLTHSEVL